jgi:ribosomal protein S18 acetylase RimI-like enzyme
VLLWGPTDAHAAADAADSILGRAGIEHRAIEVHGDALAEGLTAGLAARGFARTDVALMQLVGTPDPPATPDRGAATEVLDIDERAQAGTDSWVDDRPSMPPDEARQLGDRIRTVPDRVDATFLTVRNSGGVPVAYLDLYVADGIAQLEELHTLAAYRRLGFASALIREGLRLAEASGAAIVFLAVDANDGPVRLYERFGFRTFGQITTFTKDAPPGGLPPFAAAALKLIDIDLGGGRVEAGAGRVVCVRGLETEIDRLVEARFKVVAGGLVRLERLGRLRVRAVVGRSNGSRCERGPGDTNGDERGDEGAADDGHGGDS